MKPRKLNVSRRMELLPFLIESGFSRKDAKNLLRYDGVTLAGRSDLRHDTVVEEGDTVTVAGGKSTPRGTIVGSGMEVVFEDEHLLVIDKPSGLLSIATETEKVRTAYHQLTDYVRERHEKARIFIVHRLDKDTSGLLIFARTPFVKAALQDNWRSVTKRYHAVVEGVPEPKEGTLTSYLEETDTLLVHPSRNQEAKIAITHYRVIRTAPGCSLVELKLETGRKNQIRAQLADAGHPVIGDRKYGSRIDPAKRLALHARELHFEHPVTGKPLHFTAELPQKLRALISGAFSEQQARAVKPAVPPARDPAPRRSAPRRRD